jgi:hypothetical protein
MRAWSVSRGVTAAVLVVAGSAWAQSGQAPAPATAAPGSATAPSAAATTPAAAPGTAAPTAISPDDLAGSDRQFDLKIKGIEEKVNDLKEKIFRTKSRLLLLQETVLGGDISSSAKAVIFHVNEMSSAFVLESAAYSLDGASIFAKVDNGGDLADKESFEIFNGLIVPGNHQISVRLNYRGHGYGLFSYLDGYRFRAESSYTFSAEPGRVTVLRVVGFEKGGITTDLKDRPAVRYDVEVSKEKVRSPRGGPGGSPSSP